MTLPALARKKENPGRVYVRPSTQREVRSVTNITGRKDKSGPLAGHAAKTSAARAMQEIEAILALVQDPSISEETKAALIKQRYGTKKARNVIEREIKGARYEQKVTEHFSASEVGTLVHDMIEHWVLQGKPGLSYSSLRDIVFKADTTAVDAMREVGAWFDQFLAFEERFKPEWELIEATVWNETLGYAGTLDGLMRLPNGRRYLVDFKTGNGAYEEYGIQIEALARGEIIINPETEEESPMTDVDALAVLWIRPEFSELIEVKRHEQTWKTFLGLLEVAAFEDIQHLVFGTRVRTVANKEGEDAAA